MTTKEIGQEFKKQWGSMANVEEAKREFMDAMGSIQTWALSDQEGDALINNPYDLPEFYEAMALAIRKFQRVYHIVDTTIQWANEK